MYRLIVESLLGLRLEAGQLRFQPVLPADWDGFSMSYRYRSTWYRINVRQSDAIPQTHVWLDGEAQADGRVALVDDGAEHSVEVEQPRSI